VKLKSTVNSSGVAKEIWFACGVADALYRIIAGVEVTVTAMKDGQHMSGSLHAKGLAVDLRTRMLGLAQGDTILAGLQAALEPLGFDVVDERGKTGAPHFHVEFQAKGSEKFLVKE